MDFLCVQFQFTTKHRNMSYTKEQLRNMLTDVKLVTIPEKFKGNVDLANIEDVVKKNLEK